jgi:LAO/AO transport system kinase
MNWTTYLENIKDKNFLNLARCISLIENDVEGATDFLKKLPFSNTPVIGITGPPGAGKSTLVDALIEEIVQQQKTVAVLCIDPSSPFNLGALLGDRIRMSSWYNNDHVYIRSMATRGSLGGLHPKIMEIMDVLKAAAFDYIIVETVGVGQSEIEIAGLADVTVVVLVPEAGDEIQTMKAGLMEIANIFVVNKADRPDSAMFVNNLKQMYAPVFHNTKWQVPIIETIASQKKGITVLLQKIDAYYAEKWINEKKIWLLAQKAYQLIAQNRMQGVSKEFLIEKLKEDSIKIDFNLYNFIEKYK